MGIELDSADTSRWLEKLGRYTQNKKLFSKAGLSPAFAEKIFSNAWLTAWDVYQLFCQAKKIPSSSTFLDLGSWVGGSLLIAYEASKISKASISFIGIDRAVSEKLQQNTKSIPRLKLIKSRTDDAVNQIEDNSIDLIFLDAAHHYEQVRQDIENYWPKLKIGGIFLGHDYTSDKLHRGIVRATSEAFGSDLSILQNSRIFRVKKTKALEIFRKIKVPKISERAPVIEELIAAKTEGGRKRSKTGRKKFDVIIPYFHSQQVTTECIKSVVDYSNDYRIIATADGSRPSETASVERALHNTEEYAHLVNDRNLGFPGNTNRALRITKAEFVVVINNDIKVREGWLNRLESEYYRRGKNCFLGPAGCGVSRIGGNAKSPNFPQVDYLGWFLIFSSKESFDRVGLLDEKFNIGYYEDVDFGLRAKRLGLKSFVCSIPIGHRGGISMNSIDPRRLGHARNLNLAYLKKKWGFR